MSGCNTALVPASSLMMEALACKLFVVSGYFASNQISYHQYLHKHQMIYGLGDFRTLDWNTIDWTSIMSNKENITSKNPIRTEVIIDNYLKIFAEL